tara:strand:+ start:721 stop:867 length:147 start_codon:yes stop_codon:yes gene_type:complete
MSKKSKIKSNLDKNIFESYKKVIDSRMKAGKDVTRLVERLNLLMATNR